MCMNEAGKVLIDKEFLEYREKIIKECKDVLEKVENDLKDFMEKYSMYRLQFDEAFLRVMKMREANALEDVDKHIKLLYDYLNLLEKILDSVQYGLLDKLIIRLKVLKRAYQLLENVRDPEMEEHIIKECYNILDSINKELNK